MYELASPWILLLLPLPLLIVRGLTPIPPPLNALKLPFFKAVLPLTTNTGESRSAAETACGWLFWIALVIAASGPQWVGDPMVLPQKARNLMLAIDLSGSMQIADMSQRQQLVTRLQVVKQTANTFVQQRQGDRLGLVMFGSNAYLQAPLTFDHDTVHYLLYDATAGLAGPSTAIGDAIALSIKHFQPQQHPRANVIILLTDGVNNAGNILPLQAADIAAQRHIKIYTIGLGANRLRINTPLGQQWVNPSQELDEATLKAIAEKTGGAFFRATDPDALKRIFATINRLEPIDVSAKHYRPIINLYFYPLAAACALMSLYALGCLLQRLYYRRCEALRLTPKTQGEMQ